MSSFNDYSGRGRGGYSGRGRGYQGRQAPTSQRNQTYLTPDWQASPAVVSFSVALSSSSQANYTNASEPSIPPLEPDVQTPVQDIQPFSRQNDQITGLLLRSPTPVNHAQDDRLAHSGAVTPLSQVSTARETTPPLDDGTNRHQDGTHSDGVPSRDPSIAPRTTVSDVRNDRRPSV